MYTERVHTIRSIAHPWRTLGNKKTRPPNIGTIIYKCQYVVLPSVNRTGSDFGISNNRRVYNKIENFAVPDNFHNRLLLARHQKCLRVIIINNVSSNTILFWWKCIHCSWPDRRCPVRISVHFRWSFCEFAKTYWRRVNGIIDSEKINRFPRDRIHQNDLLADRLYVSRRRPNTFRSTPDGTFYVRDADHLCTQWFKWYSRSQWVQV